MPRSGKRGGSVWFPRYSFPAVLALFCILAAGCAEATGDPPPQWPQWNTDVHHPDHDPDHPYRLGVGDSVAGTPDVLGTPSERRRLKGESPGMGVEVWEYAFTDPVAELELPDGTRHNVSNVMLVIDGNGRLLRVVENPNPPGPADQRMLRGSPGGPGVAALFPPNARLLKRRP